MTHGALHIKIEAGKILTGILVCIATMALPTYGFAQTDTPQAPVQTQTPETIETEEFRRLFEAGRGRYTPPAVEEEATPAQTIRSSLATNYVALIMEAQKTSHMLGPYFYLLEDPEERYAPKDVMEQANDFSLNRRNTRDIVNLGYNGTRTWLVFRAFNQSEEENWLIGFGNTLEGRYGFAEYAQIYVVDPTAVRDDFEDVEKAKLTPTGHFAVTLKQDIETLVIIALKPTPGIPLTLNPSLETKGHVLAQTAAIMSPLSWLLLFLSGMVFFCLSLSLSKRSTMYLPFAGYYVLLGFVLVWNNANITGLPLLQSNILPMLTGLVAICSLGLTKIFLNIRQYDHTERYIINGLAIFIFAGAFIALLPLPLPAFIKATLLYGPTVLTFVGLPLLCFAQSQSGKSEAAPLIWAWLFILAGLIISATALSGTLTLTDITINGFWIMLAPQAFFFIFAMLKKINLEDDQIFEEKTQANKETLSLVRLRHTKESAEQARLLKVIEKERQILAQLRERDARRTEEMRQAKELADEANRAKGAFLAVVSHEVRTPMTGIMGMLRLLLDSQLNKQQKEYVQTIQESGDAMLTLLNDILDFEKIERGRMELEQISFDLRRLIQGVSTLMSGHAALKNIELKTYIDEDVPVEVIGDPNRLRQILLNLTGNAIKFTPQGEVSIRVNVESHEDGLFDIRFAVKDSGIGISAEGMKDLFTPFAQANTSITRKYGGTGLGLAICNGLIQAMGSEIKVSSKEGEGSVFAFTLQMQDNGFSAERPAILEDLPNLEDNPQEEAAQDQHTDEDDQGDEAFTPETISPQDKLSKLTKPPRILVVDDNEINLKVILGFLNRISCKADTQQSAETVLDILNDAEQSPYDMILMDIQLPKLKGDEATIKIREMEDPVMAAIPVIALSANTSDEDQEKYKNSGITAFVPKPIDPDLLLETIADVLTNPIAYRSKVNHTALTKEDVQDVHVQAPIQPTQVESAPVAPAVAAPPAPSAQDFSAVFDTETLATLKSNLGKDQLDELLTGLLDKTHEIVAALIDAQEKDDKQAMNDRAHELKGMAGNFGLVEMTEMSMQAERLLKGQEDGDLTSHIQAFPQAITRAETALKQWMAQ